MKLIFGEESYECTKAVKGKDYIEIYVDDTCIVKFGGVQKFDAFVLEDGEWSSPEPTLEEKYAQLAANVDYMAMLTDIEIPTED